MPDERDWDEISEFYKPYFISIYQRDIDFGKGMLDLIHLLRNDVDTRDMKLGTSMVWLLVALPDYDLQSVHICWVAPDTYELFLTPDWEIDEKPIVTRVDFNHVLEAVKEHLARLNVLKLQELPYRPAAVDAEDSTGDEG